MAIPKALIIDGVEVPVAYDGYTFSRNKVHSANTGRNQAGKMVGTILAIKDKVEVTLIPQTPAQIKVLDNVISSLTMFHSVKALYPDGTQKTITAYFGDVSYHYLSQALGDGGLITGTKISIIEQ